MRLRTYNGFLIFFIISICLSNYKICWTAELNTPSISATPLKSSAKLYGGYFEPDISIKDVMVKPCISLGLSCTAEISNLINDSDEFVISFMYRINSPNIINALMNKALEVPVLTFLDYSQSIGSSSYHQYVKRLINNVPTSLVKLGSVAFHHKVIITKKKGFQAIVIIGSANATYESENVHSEDMIFIESNKLAEILLTEYYNLLTMKVREKEQTVKVFHENRLNPNESNNKNILSFKEKLLETDKCQEELLNYKKADITSLAISTGFAKEEGNKACLNILELIFNSENDALIFFENFFTSNQTIKWALENKDHKLIILDDDKHNQNIKSKLLNKSNRVQLFTPYTLGKFHHKLIFQYLKNDEAVLYTGSFHPSESAITKNSEIIIGIKNKEMMFEYLSSILEQSGLVETQDFWISFFKLPNYKDFLINDNIHNVIKNTYARAKKKLIAYPEKYKRILDAFPLVTEDIVLLEINEEIENFNNLSYDKQLEELHKWNNFIVNSVFVSFYKNSGEKKQRYISEKLNIDFLKFDAYWHRYLINLSKWIETSKIQLKLVNQQFKENLKERSIEDNEVEKNEIKKEDLLNIKKYLEEIEQICFLLMDANKYPEEFKNTFELMTLLEKDK